MMMELQRKHEDERYNFHVENERDITEVPEANESEPEISKQESETPKAKTEVQTNVPTPGKKRRNRQKERLAKREAEIARIKQEALQETTIDYGKIERDQIDMKLAKLQMKEHDVKPDGHCLFASILHQLQINDLVNETNDDIYKLRGLIGDHILANKDDFLPYLIDEGDDINSYVKSIKETAKWGGDVEIMAVCQLYDCQVCIMMSEQQDPIVFNDKGKNVINLVYFKHYYSLGEHYNSIYNDARD
ncbi:hypothetical protein TBLA_0G02360 [Henningerozyma blattae CBS 6284]|uniref:OTU domain-containing protein n=1 Tax=Henningerozyma blattae (strain ATCC 34711 / CBS 6284 / DSM 70876 / NBRC 10599 / NRRL Y-10934 / UCD 77-7) TaxID=1071380 RepID=I2H724_HENB6|nr:hypothetical protein TBLA_0G02360 [Tetrapisispora blattae CBS 6284]CCH62176.1 hypothetical protein TBLA_0G02360 [Tetrapisispora blattae CBS 6284]